jgi:hypothetical protein
MNTLYLGDCMNVLRENIPNGYKKKKEETYLPVADVLTNDISKLAHAIQFSLTADNTNTSRIFTDSIRKNSCFIRVICG